MRAPVNVFGVPERRAEGYNIKDWSRIPLFSCQLILHEEQVCQASIEIELEKNNELIAKAPYTCHKEVEPVQGSAKYFVLTIVNGSLRALVGIAFIDRSDAIDFNLILQEYTRRHEKGSQLPVTPPEPTRSHRRGWDQPARLNSLVDSSSSSDSDASERNQEKATYNDLDDSSDDFGDFQ